METLKNKNKNVKTSLINPSKNNRTLKLGLSGKGLTGIRKVQDLSMSGDKNVKTKSSDPQKKRKSMYHAVDQEIKAESRRSRKKIIIINN